MKLSDRDDLDFSSSNKSDLNDRINDRITPASQATNLKIFSDS